MAVATSYGQTRHPDGLMASVQKGPSKHCGMSAGAPLS